MPLACIHTHTNFCDGHDDIETCCRAAFQKGLGSLGFSAHAPVTKKTGFRTEWHLPDDRLEEYLDAVRDAKKRWEGKLPVYLGLEVDFIEGIMGPADSDYRETGLDYIIASVHYVQPRSGRLFTVDDSAQAVERGIKECYGGDSASMVEDYFNAEAAMISSGGFDVLGHPDVIRKNKAALSGRGIELFSEDDDFYREKTAAIAIAMEGKGIAAEVNTGGMNRGYVDSCYPSLGFLKQFRKHGVPIVINADAHRAQDLDSHYAEARETMLASGYTETTLFAGRENGQAKWDYFKL